METPPSTPAFPECVLPLRKHITYITTDESFKRSFAAGGFTLLRPADIHGEVLTAMLNYYNVEKTAYAAAIGATPRTVYNWTQKNEPCINSNWTKKIEHAIRRIHAYRTVHGYETRLTVVPSEDEIRAMQDIGLGFFEKLTHQYTKNLLFFYDDDYIKEIMSSLDEHYQITYEELFYPAFCLMVLRLHLMDCEQQNNEKDCKVMHDASAKFKDFEAAVHAYYRNILDAKNQIKYHEYILKMLNAQGEGQPAPFVASAKAYSRTKIKELEENLRHARSQLSMGSAPVFRTFKDLDSYIKKASKAENAEKADSIYFAIGKITPKP